MEKIEKKDFLKIKPYKRWVLENFPFIEEDFDAITMYQMYCKLVEYLNKCIDLANEVASEVVTIEDAFNKLIDDVDATIESKFLEVKTELETLYTEFVDTVNLRLSSQDEKIDGLENTMDTFISETRTQINEIVQNLFNELIESGEIQIGFTYNEEDESLNLVTNINVGITNGENVGF